jgi:hypothetical protein
MNDSLPFWLHESRAASASSGARVHKSRHRQDDAFDVVARHRLRPDVVIHALETAVGIRDKLVGAALNKTKTGQMRRFQRWGAMIDQSRLYARYGYTD